MKIRKFLALFLALCLLTIFVCVQVSASGESVVSGDSTESEEYIINICPLCGAGGAYIWRDSDGITHVDCGNCGGM